MEHTVVLFKKADKSDVLGVTVGEFDGIAFFSTTDFYRYKDHDWKNITNYVLPNLDPRMFLAEGVEESSLKRINHLINKIDFNYQLPQFGTTAKAYLGGAYVWQCMNGEFSMFIGQAEVIDTAPETHGSYGWVKVPDVFDWEQVLVDNGIIHHGVLIHDPEVGPALKSFCHFLGIKVIEAGIPQR